MLNKFNVNETLSILSGLDLKGKKKDSLNLKNQEYNLIFSNWQIYLMNLVSNLFTWKGLPEGKNGQPLRSSFFEMMIALNGSACIGNTPTYGKVCSVCTIEGGLNPYGEPNRVKLSPYYSIEEFYDLNLTLENKGDKFEFAFFRNDNFSTGFIPLIVQTAHELTNVRMALNCNVGQQKFPVIVRSNINNKLSVDFALDKVESYEPYIVLKDDSEINLEQAKIFNANIPYVADKLNQTEIDILNSFYIRVGLNSIPNAKKERMLKDEVNANNQATQTSGDIYLQNRKEGCEFANKVFNMNLSVERNTDFIDSLNLQKGSEDNEPIHDGTTLHSNE